MKAVILAGGLGARLSEETSLKPKSTSSHGFCVCKAYFKRPSSVLVKSSGQEQCYFQNA